MLKVTTLLRSFLILKGRYTMKVTMVLKYSLFQRYLIYQRDYTLYFKGPVILKTLLILKGR